MSKLDVRWKQRLDSYSKALQQLDDAVRLAQSREFSDLEKQGLVQTFEFTHELAWNLMKDYFEFQGASELVTGSRDATREAFQKRIIEDGDSWMDMIKSRNQTSHTYNLKTANEISAQIQTVYFKLFKQFEAKMKTLAVK